MRYCKHGQEDLQLARECVIYESTSFQELSTRENLQLVNADFS